MQPRLPDQDWTRGKQCRCLTGATHQSADCAGAKRATLTRALIGLSSHSYIARAHHECARFKYHQIRQVVAIFACCRYAKARLIYVKGDRRSRPNIYAHDDVRTGGGHAAHSDTFCEPLQSGIGQVGPRDELGFTPRLPVTAVSCGSGELLAQNRQAKLAPRKLVDGAMVRSTRAVLER
jgi:hypothetical protein